MPTFAAHKVCPVNDIMSVDQKITALLPHRDPFLWVDRIIDARPGYILTEKDIPVDLDVFRGHYPGRPILPGVLLCEAVFQSGAMLIATIESADTSGTVGIPVITKISSARFKRLVRPGDTLRIEVELKESFSSVYFFKGRVQVDDKTALRIDFAATSFRQADNGQTL